MKFWYNLALSVLVVALILAATHAIAEWMARNSEAVVRGQAVAEACLAAGERATYCEAGCVYLEPLSAFVSCRDAVRYAEGAEFRERFGGDQ